LVRIEKEDYVMSRIGKMPIELRAGVEVDIQADNEVLVKSGGNTLKVAVSPVIDVRLEDGKIVLTRKNNEPQTRAWHGLYRALLYNAVIGLSSGWSKTLMYKGVGYKAQVSGQNLELSLGFSHPVKILIPKDIEVKTGKNNLTVSGADKAQVGQFCAQIRSLRKPEPYLGKGIRYSDEIIRGKAGKSGGEK